jgi:Protein of unknown function (DUF2637)
MKHERARDADGLIRLATAAVVTAVAVFAAVVSFAHIYDLGRANGQSGIAARLLPLSVDGLILAASLVLLHEARNQRPAPGLARWMLWLGIAATVAANVAYGLPFGVAGAIISAWPAVSFVGAVEMMMLMVRRARRVAAAGVTAPAAAPDMAATQDTPGGATPPATGPLPVAAPKAPPRVTARATSRGVTPQEKARRIRDAEPDITNRDLAARAGVSVRTLQRWQDSAGPDTGGDTPAEPRAFSVVHDAEAPSLAEAK